MMQKVFMAWKWKKKGIPIRERVARRNLAKVRKVKCINPDVIWEEYRGNEVVLVTGDAYTLPDDVKTFESWAIPHDIYCVNRSMLYFERPIDHWAAVDCEESTWFSENLTEKLVPKGGTVWRHTIGVMPIAYDFHWRVDGPLEGEHAAHLWMGNSGYFAILSAIEMGYEKIIIAGMPLDSGPHFYDPPDSEGPRWIGRAYTQWMDFKMKVPEAERVRSMSGYTAFILGEATKEWSNGN